MNKEKVYYYGFEEMTEELENEEENEVGIFVNEGTKFLTNLKIEQNLESRWEAQFDCEIQIDDETFYFGEGNFSDYGKFEIINGCLYLVSEIEQGEMTWISMYTKLKTTHNAEQKEWLNIEKIISKLDIQEIDEEIITVKLKEVSKPIIFENCDYIFSADWRLDDDSYGQYGNKIKRFIKGDKIYKIEFDEENWEWDEVSKIIYSWNKKDKKLKIEIIK